MVYRTMQGKEIDMDKLMRQNELVPAIGNMKINARGDEIGAGGKIVRKREEVVAAYYEKNPNARSTGPQPIPPAPVVQPEPVKHTKKQTDEE
jgi:hypothetical protein